MKRKIVIIRNAAKSDFGGGERVCVFIAREVMDHSNLSPVILSGSGKLLDFASKESVPHIKSWWWSRQDWSGPRVLLTPLYIGWQIILYLYYIYMFIKLKPSVVHIQSKDDFIAGTLAASTLNINVLWSDYADLKHIFQNYKLWYKNPIGKIVYFAAHFTNKILVVSKEDRRLVSVNIPDGRVKKKLQVVYYGAFDVYKKIDKNKIFTFISSGRIVTDKGIGELIEAFIKVHKDHKNTVLHILGDGPEREAFEKKAHPDASIKFLGHKSDPLDYVNKAHVFIIATYHEGFSIALVEACMLGMPIIATNVGGNPEIIKNRETGLLVKVKDVDSLYKAMKELYENENIRNLIGKTARKEYVDKFNFKTTILQTIIPMYERLAKQ